MSVTRVNFALNVGEVSARFEARQDKTEKYSSACRILENWLPLTMGGVRRRDGWQFSAKSKFSGLANAAVVLVDFRFSSTQAYILEFGDFYVRFFKDGVPLMDPDTPSVVHELTTPFALADLDLIKIGSFQSADVMYLCTGIYPVQKLARIETAPDRFTLSAVAFDPPATQADQPTGAEIGSGTLTLSATSGDTQTATAANSVWLAGDVGRTIVSGAGRAVITSIGSGTVANIDIVSSFSSLTIVQDDWHFEGFGDIAVDPNRRLSGQGVLLVADSPVFRSSDVGKYMLIYGGLVKLTAFSSSTKMNGVILNTMRDVPNDPSTGLPFKNPPKTTVWTLEVVAWSDTLGFPTCGCFFQSRMWLCKGQTINGSVTGDFENFSKGSNGDDAIQRTIDDDQVNPIRWIKGLRSLQIGTGGSAYEVTASTAGKALTPSDMTVLPISSRGSAKIPPIRVGGQLIHVQFGQKKIRELVFDFVTDKFKSPSLLTLAEHLTEEHFLTDAAYQQEPDSIVWVTREDGLLLALTYQEDENVIGWSEHPTTGEVTSICVIPRPTTGKDWLWASVQREINDVTETFIEFMEPDANLSREWHSLQTDAATIAAPDADFVVSGADYLEGATVRVIGDGMLFTDAVVSGGQFTLDPPLPVSQVEYGLDFQSHGLTCEPPIPPEQGGMFTCRRWKQLGMRVRHAGRGLTLNVDDSENIGLPILKPEHPMDIAVPLQEGKLCAQQTNWNPFARVRFRQTLPFPAEIMNLVGDLEIADEWCCDTVDENPDFGILSDSGSIFGAFARECGHTCPRGQFAQMVYEDGTRAAGPAIRVTPTATRNAFFGLVAAYVPDQNIVALVVYTGEPLTDIGTVIRSTAVTLVNGDVLRIEADDINPELYIVSVNGAAIITRTITNDVIPYANSCIAAVEVAEISAPIPPSGDEDQAMIAIQAANLDIVANTTLVDTDLVLALEANSTYVGHIAIKMTSASFTPDALLEFVIPSGATGALIDVAWRYAGLAFNTGGYQYNINVSVDTVVHLDFTVVTSSTPGDIKVQVAQFTSDATAITFAQFNHIVAFKKA